MNSPQNQGYCPQYRPVNQHVESPLPHAYSMQYYSPMKVDNLEFKMQNQSARPDLQMNYEMIEPAVKG